MEQSKRATLEELEEAGNTATKANMAFSFQCLFVELAFSRRSRIVFGDHMRIKMCSCILVLILHLCVFVYCL